MSHFWAVVDWIEDVLTGWKRIAKGSLDKATCLPFAWIEEFRDRELKSDDSIKISTSYKRAYSVHKHILIT